MWCVPGLWFRFSLFIFPRFYIMYVEHNFAVRNSLLCSCHCSHFSSFMQRALPWLYQHLCTLKEYIEGAVVTVFEDCMFNLPICIANEPFDVWMKQKLLKKYKKNPSLIKRKKKWGWGILVCISCARILRLHTDFMWCLKMGYLSVWNMKLPAGKPKRDPAGLAAFLILSED